MTGVSHQSTALEKQGGLGGLLNIERRETEIKLFVALRSTVPHVTDARVTAHTTIPTGPVDMMLSLMRQSPSSL